MVRIMETDLKQGQTNSNGSGTIGITFHLLLHLSDPFFALFFNFLTLEPEMSMGYLFIQSFFRVKRSSDKSVSINVPV